MKSEAKTKFSSGEGRKSFRSWPRRTNGQRFAERASAPSSLGFARRQPSPRIHSTVRFGERSQAHMGDSELGCCFSLEASSFSAKLLSLSPHFVARSKVIGELSGQGTSQLRGLSRTACPSRRFGSLPASRIRCRCRLSGARRRWPGSFIQARRENLARASRPSQSTASCRSGLLRLKVHRW